MGRDKALLELDGVSLVERAARKLGSVCSRVVIADGGRGTAVREPSVPDGPGRGPAAGILGASDAFPGVAMLVLACDLPRIPIGLLGAIATCGNGDLVLPRWNEQLEPLCALYRPRALNGLRAQVAHGVFAPHRLASRPDLAVEFLEGDPLRSHGEPLELFTNLNEPADLERLRGRRGDDR
jgi:molybdopterin-guanine dinucleotide biosynthesis protein A